MLIWSTLLPSLLIRFSWAQKSDCSYTTEANERFDSNFLGRVCEKKLNWVTNAFEGIGKSLSDLLDESQLQYLNKIQTCDFLCICKEYDWCKQLLTGVETGIDSVKNISSITGLEGLGLPGDTNDKDKGKNKSKEKGKDKNKGNSWGNLNKTTSNVDLSGATDILGKLGKKGKRQAGRPPIRQGIRKEYRMMTDEERKKFHYALNRLKTTRIGGKTQYDIMIVYHTPQYSPGAHFGAAFLPFHRQFLKLLEVSLRLYVPEAAIPYWDSTLDELLPNPADSIIWSEDFMGNNQGEVNIGPFANWTVYPNERFTLTPKGGKIVRAAGRSSLGSLYKQKDLIAIMAKPTMKQLAFCNDPYMELVHGAVHIWVGGQMTDLDISPNDPAFFILHSYVDYVWELWRQKKQDRNQREADYPIDSESCNSFQTGSARMKPFQILNRDGLANNYTDINYKYDPSPTCDLPNCGSPYLFCDTRANRCVSKVVLGGQCQGFEQFDICYNSKCQRGKCVPGGPEIRLTTPPITTTPTTTTTEQTTVKTTRTSSTVKSTPTATTTKSTTSERLTIPDNFFQAATTTVEVTDSTTNTAKTTSEFGVRTQSQSATEATTPETTSSTVTSEQTTKNMLTANAEAATKPKTVATTPTEGTPTVTSLLTSTTPIINIPQSHDNQDSFPDTLWIPVTVVKPNEKFQASRVPGAKLVSKSKTVVDGLMQTRNDYPYYEGIAFAPVESPAKSGHSDTLITVTDTDGKKCKSLCYTGSKDHYYKQCDGHIHLDVDRQKSDSIAYTPAKEQTPYLSWDGPIRRPNYLLFVCNIGDDDTVRMKDAIANVTGVTTAGNSVTEENNIHTELVVAPATTTTSQKPFNDKEGCINRHRCCTIWSDAGECERNPTWMKVSCERSCKVCSIPSNSTCQDSFAKCPHWYANGECKRNPAWMEENCPSACSVCERKSEELKPLCGEPLIQECTNFNEKCDSWSASGECKTNAWWMSHNCPLACGKCTLR